MKKVQIILALLIGTIGLSKAQSHVEVGSGFGGEAISPVASFHKNWELGSKKKFVVGTGLRYTGFFGKDVNFTSAPNDLAIDPINVDTLLGASPTINSLNVLINLGFNVSEKIQIGFNIDAIGFSFGPTGTPSYIKNGVSTTSEASPTSPNILLVGNNDKGSLNSHFYGKLNLSEKIGVKIAYQYLFNELTTSTIVQSIPSANDRFRVKSGQVFIGLNYNF
jgi:hypothetical protein